MLKFDRGDIRVIFVFSLISGLLALATPVAVETLVNTISFGRLLQPVVILSIMLFVFLAFAALLQVVETYVAEIIQRRIFIRTVSDLSYRLPRVAYHAWDDHYGPEFVNRFFGVVIVQKSLAFLLLDGLNLLLQTAIGMAVIAFYHPILLGFDMFLLLMMILIVWLAGRGAVTSSIKESRAKYAVGAWIQELARHRTLFRDPHASILALETADHLASDYLAARRLHFRIYIRQVIFARALQVVGSTVLLGLGGWLVIEGELTLGQLVAAELIVTVIVGSFAKLGKHIEAYYDLLAAVEKLGKILDLPVEPHQPFPLLGGDGPLVVHLKDVTVAHPLGQPLARGFSLHIESGERLAVTGSTADARTVLLETLYGLREPHAGRIEVGDRDLRDLSMESLRSQIALVRAIEVFEGSLMQNVHLERPGIADQQILDALERIGLLESLLALPQGLNTTLHTDGHPLGEDQLRRLMLAGPWPASRDCCWSTDCSMRSPTSICSLRWQR